MEKILLLPDALEAAGVVVKVMDNAEVPHKGGTYKWREPGVEPAGHMAHHTASSAYTPNRDKANGYMGMGDPNGTNPRLYQVGGGGRVPIYTIANFVPGPITSGSGRRDVLDNFVKQDAPFVGKQTLPDDSNGWAGNTHYWNTENVLDGVGTAMPQEMWDTYVVVCQVLNDLMGWTSARIIGHGMHTKRKPDLYDGRFADMAATIAALRMNVDDSDIVLPPPVNPPDPVEPPPVGDEYMRPTLREGDGYVSGANPDVRGAVVGVQQQLAYHGHADRNTADGSSCAADGAFGSGTDAAVKSFQSAKGLTADGIVGNKTYTKLDLPKG